MNGFTVDITGIAGACGFKGSRTLNNPKMVKNLTEGILCNIIFYNSNNNDYYYLTGKKIMTKINFRNTNQRKIIFKELKKSKKHPTAMEIYDSVRNRLPNISLGTVYRNLDVLREMGLVKRIYSGDSQMHFDACLDDHNHIRCLGCGKVRDIQVDPSVEFDNGLKNQDNFEIIGYNIEFVGLCPDCKNN